MTNHDKTTPRAADERPGARSTTEDERQAKRDANADTDREMTEDGHSVAAGSGNTLGDGMTAGGADRTKERKPFQDD